MSDRKPGALLGLDLGTTHCKAGLFGLDGSALQLASRDMPVHRLDDGAWDYDPQQVWQVVKECVRAVMAQRPDLMAIGITSMAETGLLVDGNTGQPRSGLLPWLDPCSTPQARKLGQRETRQESLQRRGIEPSFKCSLAKILWLRQNGVSLAGTVWLPAASYIAYRLTGCLATDFSLAGRTFAFRLDRNTWDEDLLCELGLSNHVFPPLVESSTQAGQVRKVVNDLPELPSGVPVVIAGHDHLVAAYAAGAMGREVTFDSMGTAETLVGGFAERPLSQADALSGLLFGRHVVPGTLYWMGSLSASGGSLEWLRDMLADPPLSYEDLAALSDGLLQGPGSLFYFPYLSGSASPQLNSEARAAFLGLSGGHHRRDLVRAVLEGVAYQMEAIRLVAEAVSGSPIEHIRAAGGGTRFPGWLQLKADISGCTYESMEMPEAAALGAALLGGVGAGVYASPQEALKEIVPVERQIFAPDPQRHHIYQQVFQQWKMKMNILANESWQVGQAPQG